MVRDLNDRLYGLLRDIREAEGRFECECGDPGCGRLVVLSLQEYVAVRLSGGRGVLAPEHG
jgi:hypothetical protein